jgi:hypothetical protein
MYTRILVPLENSRTDEAIVAHVRSLSEHCRASIVLIHVADGFAARNLDALELRGRLRRGGRARVRRSRH